MSLEENYKMLLARTEKLEKDLAAAVEVHRRDVELIGETMLEAAQENDFCPIFDQYVDGLNAQLYFKLPTREQEFDVVMEYHGTIEFTVVARDEDHAAEVASMSRTTAEFRELAAKDARSYAEFGEVDVQ